LKRIYLIRHCKAEGQAPEAGLAPEGCLQAEQLVGFFASRPVDFIISSPYERAVSTIRPLAEAQGIVVQTDERLRERVLSGGELDQWMDKLKQTFVDLDLKFAGGESSRDAIDRGMAVIREMIGRLENDIVMVTHGNLMSLLLMQVGDGNFGFNEWRSLTNPDVFELSIIDREVEQVSRIWVGYREEGGGEALEWREILNHLKNTRQNLLELISAIDEEQLHSKPDERSWSISQICEHLWINEELFIRAIDAGLRRDDDHVVGDKSLELATDRSQRIDSPAISKPVNNRLSYTQIREKLLESRQRLSELLNSLEEPDVLHRRFYRHSVFDELSLYQWVELLYLHEQRHIEQIHDNLHKLLGGAME
jgi:2,3-bisphosphoglycerate-dependent phosphoglycerate mutase